MTLEEISWRFVIPALVSAVVALAIAYVNRRTTSTIAKDRLDHEKTLADNKVKFDIDLTERKFKFDRELAERKLESDTQASERKFEFDRRLAEQKSTADAQLAVRKFEFDRELSERKIRLDQAFADWKRRTELAEQVLADFYKAKELFQSARQPFSTSSEGLTRERSEDETETETSYKNYLYAPFERLAKNITFFTELNARKHRFAALFGPEALEPFAIIVTSYNRVASATDILIEDYDARRQGQDMDDKTRKEFMRIIGRGYDDANDEIGNEIKRAVSKIEAICIPILRSSPQ
ncbi:hypothetical protein ACN28S_07375 [Cystobacter fuscus]